MPFPWLNKLWQPCSIAKDKKDSNYWVLDDILFIYVYKPVFVYRSKNSILNFFSNKYFPVNFVFISHNGINSWADHACVWPNYPHTKYCSSHATQSGHRHHSHCKQNSVLSFAFGQFSTYGSPSHSTDNSRTVQPKNYASNLCFVEVYCSLLSRWVCPISLRVTGLRMLQCQRSNHKESRALSQYKDGISRYAFSIIKIRRWSDRLIFIMGILSKATSLYWDGPRERHHINLLRMIKTEQNRWYFMWHGV